MEVAKFIRQRLKIRHINVLVVLDETLSVSRTAERLNVTQAAVSRTLAEAEKGFGIELFERHSRGLRRNAPGRETLRAIRQIQSDIAALEALTDQHGSVSRGEINIGLHTVSAVDVVARLISRFKLRYPEVRIRVRDGLLPELLDDLRNSRLDLVVGRLDSGAAGRGLETRVLVEVDVYAIVASAPELLEAEELPELVRHPWCLPLPGTPMRREFDRLCEQEGCAAPEDLVESNNAHLMAQLLLTGPRLALVPRPFAQLWRDTMGLHCRPFRLDFASEPMGLISVEGKRHTPAVAAFLDFQAEAVEAEG